MKTTTKNLSRNGLWWQSAVGYQIYPRSFCDSNGDGIGDIPGIVSKLDYLADLGVGFIWLSPVYDSPMVDNGYDISDYENIAPEFGSLDDMDRLLGESAKRGIGIVMDLVVNHTSDQHAWFKDSRSSRTSTLRDWYVWRDPAEDGGPPNALQSMFGGPAWTFDQNSGQYYLHFFDSTQPDLNWSNADMRGEIHAMMNRWFDRGIAGFRMDVIDLIGKDVDRGISTDGPMLHPYLQEMHRACLADRDALTVGEAWSVRPDTALQYCGRDREELSMVFQFEHVTSQYHPQHGKWHFGPVDVPALKASLNTWQAALAEDGWNALFWSNHDLPRTVSAWGDDGAAHRVASAKALATILHLMKGTPFIYQGEELGMTNPRFARLEQFRDVETLNQHRLLTADGSMDPEAFLAAANRNGRDTARTPMHWTDGEQAGFTRGTPWIEVAANYRQINAASQQRDPASVLAHYRRLCHLRRDHPVVVHGQYTPYLEEHPSVMAYVRQLGEQRLLVIGNLSSERVDVELPAELADGGETLITNARPRARLDARVSLAPWEALANWLT